MDATQLKYIFPGLISICREFVFKCPRYQRLARKTARLIITDTVERFHGTMKCKLTALIHDFDDEWVEALPATLLAMRTSVNRTTGFTPFFLEHGREARVPVDMIA